MLIKFNKCLDLHIHVLKIRTLLLLIQSSRLNRSSNVCQFSPKLLSKIQEKLHRVGLNPLYWFIQISWLKKTPKSVILKYCNATHNKKKCNSITHCPFHIVNKVRPSFIIIIIIVVSCCCCELLLSVVNSVQLDEIDDYHWNWTFARNDGTSLSFSLLLLFPLHHQPYTTFIYIYMYIHTYVYMYSYMHINVYLYIHTRSIVVP